MNYPQAPDPRARIPGAGRSLEALASRSRASLLLGELVGEHAVEDAVDPLLVAPVRLAAGPLAREARSLGVTHRTFVEAVDLHLYSVKAELAEEVTLEEARSRVG